MSETSQRISLIEASGLQSLFPVLTADQIARIAAHGRPRHAEKDEILAQAGELTARFFVVISGEIEIVAVASPTQELIAVVRPGMFTGEASMLSGRRGFAQLIAVEPSEVIEVERENLLGLVQTDSELSDILMRAFILRRVELIERHLGDVVLVGRWRRLGERRHSATQPLGRSLGFLRQQPAQLLAREASLRHVSRGCQKRRPRSRRAACENRLALEPGSTTLRACRSRQSRGVAQPG